MAKKHAHHEEKHHEHHKKEHHKKGAMHKMAEKAKVASGPHHKKAK